MDDSDTTRDAEIALNIAASVQRMKSVLSQLEAEGNDLTRVFERAEQVVHAGLDDWRALTDFHPFAELDRERSLVARASADEIDRGTKVRFSESNADTGKVKSNPRVVGKDPKIVSELRLGTPAPKPLQRRAKQGSGSKEQMTLTKSLDGLRRADAAPDEPKNIAPVGPKIPRDRKALDPAPLDASAKKARLAQRRRDQRAKLMPAAKPVDRSANPKVRRPTTADTPSEKGEQSFGSVLAELTRELAASGSSRETAPDGAPDQGPDVQTRDPARSGSETSPAAQVATSPGPTVHVAEVESDVETAPRTADASPVERPRAPDRHGQSLFDFAYRHGVDLT